MYLVDQVTAHLTAHLNVFLDKEPLKNQLFARGREKRFKGAIRQLCLQKEIQSPALGRKNPRHHYALWVEQLESSSAEKDLGVLVDTKLTMGQQCTLATKTANRPLGCTIKNFASRSREVNLPLCSALVSSHPECWVLLSAAQYRRDTVTLVRVQTQKGPAYRGAGSEGIFSMYSNVY